MIIVCAVIRIWKPKGTGSNFSWQPKVYKVDCNDKVRRQHYIKNQVTEHLCSIKRRRKKIIGFLCCYVINLLKKKTKTKLVNSQHAKVKYS